MRSRGFTLIELITIMVIVGIMAAVAIPRMSALNGYDERGLHDKLKASLQFARKTAVASRRFVCLTVTNGMGGTVSLRLEKASPESTTGNCNNIINVVDNGVDLNPPSADTTTGCARNQICAGANLSLAGSSFRFDPLGRLDQLANVTFSTTGQPNIVIQAETGNVQ